MRGVERDQIGKAPRMAISVTSASIVLSSQEKANVELDFLKTWFLEYFPFKTLHYFLFPEL